MGHGAGLGHVATVIVEGLTDFSGGAVLIIRGDFDDEADTAWGVAFVDDLFIDDAGDLASALLDRALDIVRRHIGGAGLINQRAQTRIGFGTATAGAGCEADFLGEHRENLAALGVNDGLVPLRRVPFTMTRHGGGVREISL